jgi:carboxyl-terminal processing protease
MFYVDTIQENKLVEKAIISVLKDLDPHSIYVSKEDVREMNEPLIGSFDGIGISFDIFKDTVYIISTHSGGPSEKVGVKAGDRIVSVEGENIAGIGISIDGVKEKLSGKKGTNVSIGIKRKNASGVKEFLITREQIPIYSIDAAYKVNDKVGYIKLNKFSANSLDEFTRAAKKLKRSGVDHLILDLRDNGGGYLKTAIDLADQFLGEKKMIVYTKGMSSPKSEYFSSSKGIFKKGRIAILINEGTASASEIVSGAIQDWDKGILVGRRSYGKGLVQRPFNLMDGSLIRLTIARYYTPTGRLIQKPYDHGYAEYSNDIMKRINHGEMFSEDSIHFADSLKHLTLSEGRTVYGGGGIMPDVFVPLDTTLYPDYYRKITKNGKLNEFVIDYIDKNRENINTNYPEFEDFKIGFQVDESLLKDLLKFAILENIQDKLSKEELLAVKINNSFEIPSGVQTMSLDNAYVKNHLKALLARDLWGIKAYYQVLNMNDDTFLKALELINDESKYQLVLSGK